MVFPIDEPELVQLSPEEIIKGEIVLKEAIAKSVLKKSIEMIEHEAIDELIGAPYDLGEIVLKKALAKSALKKAIEIIEHEAIDAETFRNQYALVMSIPYK